jgi:predicted metalloprotease with PDZ domain
MVFCVVMAKKTKREGRSVITTARDPRPIDYGVAMPQPQTHEFHIEMRVPALPHSSVEIVFPCWAPGSYMVRDFVRHVYGLQITDEAGRALPFERLDKQRWSIVSEGVPFVVRYRVFAFETTVRTSFLDDSHGYWNGTSLFFAVDGELTRPCQVRVAAPDGWEIATALDRVRRAPGKATAGAREATFLAANYDQLVDSPFEIGRHSTERFHVEGTSFELALYGRTNADVRRLVDILRRVVRATAAIFGGFPFDRYLFIVHALPAGSGGLEHMSSVTMDIAGLSFEDDKAYHRFADLAAHEFFHAWNVKRLHDPALGPFDYTKENYTRLLWFHEGFTDYLANVIILRAGITTEGDFWRWIAEDWPRYATRPGRNETPIAELSFEAWIKQYKPAENHINNAVSYYEKGLWIAMALDIELRLAGRANHGLPEMFRWLWDRVGRREADITETMIREAAREIAGRSMDLFFDRYIHGSAEIPIPSLLRRAGVDVRLAPLWSPDSGESDAVKRERARSWSGVLVQPQAHPAGAERAVIKNVTPKSPAADAGLTFGDEIVAVNGDRVNATTFGRRLSDHRPGTSIDITFFRRDQLKTATVVVGVSPERKLSLKPDARASTRAVNVRAGWLGFPRA